jgi:hypothetical protein
MKAYDAMCHICVPVMTMSQLTMRLMIISICVAVMNDYFQMMPMSMRIGQGDTAVLKCLAPKANPRPEVSWLKNGEPVNPMDSKRIHITDTGRLKHRGVKARGLTIVGVLPNLDGGRGAGRGNMICTVMEV